MQKAYEKTLENTIKTILEGDKVTTGDILSQTVSFLLEAERTTFLQYEKGSFPVGSNKRNGYYERFLETMNGKLRLQIPRDRFGEFHPLCLEVLKQDSERMNELSLALYSQGVSHRGTQKIFKSIFGSSYSPQRISNLVSEFQEVRKEWDKRPLDEEYHALVVDAVYINIRRDSVEKEAIYIVMGLKKDFSREILSIVNIPQESATGWKLVLQDLQARGVKKVGLFISDECAGIESAIEKEFPKSSIQFCIVHKKRNLMSKVRPSHKEDIINDFDSVLDIDNQNHTPQQFLIRIDSFLDKWGKIYPSVRNMFPERKLSYFCSVLNYPVTVRRMLYTSNWIERFNKEVRKITRHTNSFPNPDSALNLIFMTSQNMQNTYLKPIYKFRSVDPHMISILDLS